MSEIFLDTHVVIWLYAGELKSLSKPARVAIERYDLAVSPAVKLELGYLHEIGRLRDGPALILEDLSHRVGLVLRTEDFGRVIEQALSLTWTRDVFDRLIVAHAAIDARRLVSRDRAIRKHYDAAVW